MATGKLSPRQKMINLMYLIFIAMLAMNMSKEVLQAFGLMDTKLATANEAATSRNKTAYEDLALKAVEQSEKYGDEKTKADKIKKLSDEFYGYIEGIKEEMKASVDDPTDYETMDSEKFLDSRFFKGDAGKYHEEGQMFVDNMNNYRDQINTILGDGSASIKSDVNSRFSTEMVKNREGKDIHWLDYNYKGFPLVASITKMTQVQADIKTTETEILGNILQGQMASDVSMNN